jgi:hypothetical protein
VTYNYEAGNTILDTMACLVADGPNISRTRLMAVLHAHINSMRWWTTSIAMPTGDIVLDIVLMRDGTLAVLASVGGMIADYRTVGGIDNDRQTMG